MESRKAKIIFTRPGGTAGKNSQSSRITLPITWVREMGISEDNREVQVCFDGKTIMIKKETN
ncbi:hypothetical protein FND36_10075 [Lachnospiraceae bacterium KGMB03038]|nr:hypothetical protein FND36_10075 [Lachnospiraceae bacterium KGMB03038]